MSHDKADIKSPDQERFRKHRLLAQKLASWRSQRGLVVTIAVMLALYCLFSLPWDKWDVLSRLRHLREESPPKTYVPFTTAGLDGQRALDNVKGLLAIGPRASGTDGARKAADYLADRLKAAGVNASVSEFSDTTPDGPITFRNVLGMLDPTAAPVIILASHYDTKTGLRNDFVGANDSGSSSGLLLELARCLREQPGPKPGILFAFLDGEECMQRYAEHDGLHGSRHLARDLAARGSATNVLGVIVLDMVGDRDLTITLPNNGSPELISMVLTAARQEEVRLKFSLMGAILLDDHDPFLRVGMPAVDVVDFQYGSQAGRNDYWHTSEDTLDKLSAESLGTIGRVTIRVVNQLLEKASGTTRPQP